MKPIDYSQTIMYKLVPKDLNSDLIYVGHTTNFRQRKYSHKSNCNNTNGRDYNLKVYEMIRENGGWNEWQMIQIEEFCCKNKREAEKRERELMEEFNSKLNSILPFCSRKEYLEKNKEKIIARTKIYYEKNKERIALEQKEYNIQNKEKINTKSKLHYEKNKDAILLKHKLYNEKNKNINKDVKLARRRELRQQKKLALKLEENSV